MLEDFRVLENGEQAFGIAFHFEGLLTRGGRRCASLGSGKNSAEEFCKIQIKDGRLRRIVSVPVAAGNKHSGKS